MREPIDKLYLLMLQAFRHEMGLLDDKTWSENLDILLEAERDQAKTKLNAEFGVSSAGYNNDSIFKGVPDEEFWNEQDYLHTETKYPTIYAIDKILEGETDGDLIFVFPNSDTAKKVYDYLSKLLSRNALYSVNVAIEELDNNRMGIYKLYMKDGDNKRLKIGFKKAVYVATFIGRFVRFSKFGNYFIMEGE